LQFDKKETFLWSLKFSKVRLLCQFWFHCVHRVVVGSAHAYGELQVGGHVVVVIVVDEVAGAIRAAHFHLKIRDRRPSTIFFVDGSALI
jgi:hypothetical protein